MNTDSAHGYRKYFTFKNLVLNLFIVFVYIISGKLGLTLAFANASATAVWPPTGIALASIIIFGPRVIPAIFIGAFFVNVTTAGTILTSLGIALGNSLEGIVGAYLVKRFANGIHAFERVGDIFKFTFFASILATTVSANIGMLSLILGGLEGWNNFFQVWLTWWLGDMGGSLVVAPLILVWWTHHRIPLSFKQAIHFAALIFCIFIITWFVFFGIVPYPYLYIPLAVWGAFWFGRRGATVLTIIVAITAIFYTIHGVGPFIKVFASDSINTSLIQLQLFLNVFSLTALTFATTILEVRKTEKTLASHEMRFQSLIEKSTDAIFLVDATSKILYASPSIKRVLGFTPEELKGTIGFKLVVPEDRNLTIRVLAEIVLKPGGSSIVEARLVRKDKTIIWVEATGTNLLLDPTISAVVVNFRDITDKKSAEDLLLEEKLTDEAMLGSIGDGIIATDDKGKITMINHAACEMLGFSEKDLIGKSLIDSIAIEDELEKPIPVDNRPLTKVLSNGKKIAVTSETVYYVRKDGAKFPVRFNISPIIFNKRIVGTIEVFHDVTKEKEIDKAKTEFVSVASHQLRTPLAIINWCVEELVRTQNNLDTKQQGYLEKTYLASKRMIALINSLLNASRLELGTLNIEPETLDLAKSADQVLQDFVVKIREKEIDIKKDFQQDLPPIVADPKLLTIVIQNLISNAVKYSGKKGKITLKISSNNKEFLIEVTDNGYGIPKLQQSKIFTKLFRADNARAMEPEGTGLGLYIVKEIVETTGGSIEFSSEEDKGSTFKVTFPIVGMTKKEGQKSLD